MKRMMGLSMLKNLPIVSLFFAECLPVVQRAAVPSPAQQEAL
jgi:hypothetical protein